MRRALLLCAALSFLLPAQATAYGIATHTWLAEAVIPQLVAADAARFQFLQSDPDAKACYMYGAFFPDTRSVTHRAPGYANIKQKIEDQIFVEELTISLDGAKDAYSVIDTHDCDFVLHLVAEAQATGDPYKIAFAYGNLTHVMQDKHAQVVHLPWRTHQCECGDLGVDPTEFPSRAAGGWYPGRENELFFEGFGDQLRPDSILSFMKDAPWRLAADPTASYDRAMELRRFYFRAAESFNLQRGRTPPTEDGILNGAKLFEASNTLYPVITGKEALADGFRTLIDRYVRLTWWASLTVAVVHTVVAAASSGQDLYDVLGPWIPMEVVGGAVGGESAAGEILLGYANGQAEIDRLRQKYANNEAFVRLDRPGGFLDPSAYDDADYDLAHYFVVHGLTNLQGSNFTNDDIWPRFSRQVMRAAATRSLLRMSGTPDVADSPALLLWELRYLDPATGSPYSEVLLPGDVGRELRVEVELFGSDATPQPRLVRLRLRADTGAGPSGDPILAQADQLIPAQALDLTTYGDHPRPVVAVTWTVADPVGAEGVYVEVDERRLTLVADESQVDRLFTSELSLVEPLIDGRPHYDAHYGTYEGSPASLPFRR